jgi:phosphoenolpyruvate carboxykinase (ATP)
VGNRCPLKYTRAILDAIHSGELAKAEYEVTPIFGLHVPKKCTGVPDDMLHPERVWLPQNGTLTFCTSSRLYI